MTSLREAAGICWMRAGTVGHLTRSSDRLLGVFPSEQGVDGLVACDLVPAGKYRNGAARAWCRTHQTYWGVKADLADLEQSGQARCALHAEPMGYALGPPVLDVMHYPAVAVRYGGPQQIAVNVLGGSCAALAIAVDGAALFGNAAITRVEITPPALLAFLDARRAGKALGCALGCMNCARCRHPHLDLGDFALQPHRRHYCGNCGCDSTHSSEPMMSSPLHALCMAYGARLSFL